MNCVNLEFRARAHEFLAHDDPAVLVPAEEGGFRVIGLAAKVPLDEVFCGIPWSTDAVFEATLSRLRAAETSRPGAGLGI